MSSWNYHYRKLPLLAVSGQTIVFCRLSCSQRSDHRHLLFGLYHSVKR